MFVPGGESRALFPVVASYVRLGGLLATFAVGLGLSAGISCGLSSVCAVSYVLLFIFRAYGSPLFLGLFAATSRFTVPWLLGAGLPQFALVLPCPEFPALLGACLASLSDVHVFLQISDGCCIRLSGRHVSIVADMHVL